MRRDRGRRRPDPLDPPDEPPTGWGDKDSDLGDLKSGARTTAERVRGHNLGPWSDGDRRSAADCQRCGAGVSVCPNPLPNGIPVSGQAVAVDCPEAEP